MRVLVTRPRPDGEETARQLTARGHEPVLAPLLEIVPETGAAIDLSGVQAVLVTSANGSRALAAATDRRDVPVFAVGSSTAAVAEAAGFKDVASAAGDVAALADLVESSLKPEDGRLLHVAGSVTAGDLSARMTAAGFEIERAVLYRAEMARKMPESAFLALKNGELDAILLFSPRTAAGFAEMAAVAGLDETLRSVRAVCLSPAVADAVDGLPFRSVDTAVHPDQDALLAALEDADT